MPEDEKGEKGQGSQPEVPPTSDESGVEVKDDAGTPSAEGEDKTVPLAALTDERGKRQTAEARLAELEAKLAETEKSGTEQPTGEQTEQLFDWENFIKPPEESGEQEQTQPAGYGQMSSEWDGFAKWFAEEMDSGDHGRMLAAQMRVSAVYDGQKEMLKDQARTWVPGYDALPLHEIRPEQVQMLQQNPEAIRALMAQVRRTASASKGNSNPSTEQPSTEIDKLKEQYIQQGREEAYTQVRTQGQSAGMTGEAPSSGAAPSADTFEFDDATKAQYRRINPNLTDEQLRERAKQVHESQKLRQTLGGE